MVFSELGGALKRVFLLALLLGGSTFSVAHADVLDHIKKIFKKTPSPEKVTLEYEDLLAYQEEPSPSLKLHRVRVSGIGAGGDLYVVSFQSGVDSPYQLEAKWAEQAPSSQKPIFRRLTSPAQLQSEGSLLSFNCYPYAGAEKYKPSTPAYLVGLALDENQEAMGDDFALRANLDSVLCINNQNEISVRHTQYLGKTLSAEQKKSEEQSKAHERKKSEELLEIKKSCQGAQCVVSDYVSYLVKEGKNNENLSQKSPNSRTAIGYRELKDGQREIVIAATVNKSQKGFSLYDWGEIMEKMKLTEAINTDGGGSTWLEVRDPKTKEVILSVSEEKGALYNPQGLKKEDLPDQLRPLMGILELKESD